MGNTFLQEEQGAPMLWRGVVSEQRERFLEDYRLNYYSLS